MSHFATHKAGVLICLMVSHACNQLAAKKITNCLFLLQEQYFYQVLNGNYVSIYTSCNADTDMSKGNNLHAFLNGGLLLRKNNHSQNHSDLLKHSPEDICANMLIFSLPGRSPGRAIVLRPALASALASASALAVASALAKSITLKFFM